MGYYERALAVAAQVGDRRRMGSAFNGLGHSYVVLGQVERAINRYQQAMDMARAVGNRRGECVSLGGMGFGYAALGQLTRALGFYSRPWLLREIGDHGEESIKLANLGDAYYALGQFVLAIGLQEQALAIAIATRRRRGEGVQRRSIGKIYAALGEVTPRDRLHRTRLGDRAEVGDRRSEGYALFHRARVFVDEDRHVDAIQQASEAVQIGAETGVPIIISSANTTLALARLCLGDLPSAAQPFLPPLPSMSPRIPITCWRSWG